MLIDFYNSIVVGLRCKHLTYLPSLMHLDTPFYFLLMELMSNVFVVLRTASCGLLVKNEFLNIISI
jgi:hypothetical protein